MKEKLKNKKVIIVSLISIIIFLILLLTLKDSYAYYGGSNELPIIEATIGKLKPTIDKVYIEDENKQYTNNPNPSVTIEWTDDNITEYCVTTESTCTDFKNIQEPNNKSITVTNQITLNSETNHTVNAYIKNKYGYISEVKSSSITLDTTAPTISNVTSTEITETTITVSVTGSDANGIKQYCYGTSQNDYTCTDSSNHTFSNLSAGKEYTFWFYLVDNASNDNKANPTQKQFTTESKTAKDIIIANSSSLESEEEMQTRNAQINSAGGNVEDDLRRFVGDKTKVIDNFICFGTTDQTQCKNNMDTYMYRIIGIDTNNRLKLIKATKVKKGSQSTFSWHNTYSSNTTWENSDLYKGLNGQSPKSGDTYTCNQCFGNGSEYSYMKDTQWTNLIVKPDKWYIGDSTDNTNPSLFQKERGSNITNGDKIGLMYLSDYLYANNGNANTSNWLFIQNGLNGNHSSLGNGATAPTAEIEWTMTRYGKSSSNYYAWYVYSSGTVDYDALHYAYAVRPVFYIDSSMINLKGTGIIEDPYYITNVN